MLKLVLVNLISNAVKFTRLRSPAEVEIGCADGTNGAEVFVRGNGAGFDMRYVDKLFGVFQRLHPAEEFEGTGIGLATVQPSSIGTEGKSGPRESWIMARHFISRFQNIQSRAVEFEHMDKFGRILLVEDDPRDVELSLNALEEYNLANEVVIACDGQEAIDYLRG